MYMQKSARSQLLLSLAAWAVVIALFLINRWYVNRRPVPSGVPATARPHRVLVLANQDVGSGVLLDELAAIGADKDTVFHVVVPASPIETGTAATHGPLDVFEATKAVAYQRLESALTLLRSENLSADGEIGDYRPLRALASAVESFNPDQIIISTPPPEQSVWHRFEVVDRARSLYQVPVTNVIVSADLAEPSR
jgi:GABA permease